jgi:anaerobic ribonucleoside-triphosphate reductase activating protein
MRYNLIRKMDISNGEGIRVSIFVQGCSFHCPNCFNPETHDFDGGKEFNGETIDKILELCDRHFIVGLSILGGEPLHYKNRDDVTKLAKAFKERYPNKNIWLWTGYEYETVNRLEIMNYVDVVIDGMYVDKLHDFNLKWKGSSNQRVIDVKESLETGMTIIYKNYYD